MTDIDPELRDKIIETHTLVKRIDEDHKDFKKVMNVRMTNARISFEKHQDDVKETFEKHEDRIAKGETFRTRIMAYASVVAVIGSFAMNFIVAGAKKFLGI